MISRILLATVLSVGLLTPVAHALTVINADNVTHKIMYKPNGGAMRPILLKGHHSKNVGCITGCALTVGKTKSLFGETTDKVWIRHNRFVRG